MSQAITAATNADPVVCTSTAHGLSTGGKITVVGGTGAWAALNGGWIVTRLGADTFSLPINSTAFGTLAGTVTFTGSSGRELSRSQKRVPRKVTCAGWSRASPRAPASRRLSNRAAPAAFPMRPKRTCFASRRRR